MGRMKWMKRLRRPRHADALERSRLEALVTERTRELTDLTRHLQTAREDERARLARDLHDELGALLTSAKLDAARIRARLGANPPATAEALERLAHLVGHLDGVIAIKRRITEDLRPSALSHLGLVVTLEILARDFGDSSGLILLCDFSAVRLGPAAELVVYRVVQEALNNIAKHAGAGTVRLRLTQAGERVQLSVADDGCGFDPLRLNRPAHGLMGMRFRVEAEQGRLHIDSAPTRGTTLRVELPAAAADAACAAGTA
jgi:signal transduction histidine kinase